MKLFSFPLKVDCLALWLLIMTAVTGFAPEIHEEGYCVMRGQCGKKAVFGKQLNCPYNEPAVEVLLIILVLLL